MDWIKRKLLNFCLPLPITARHLEHSLIVSSDDDQAHPSQFLLSLAVKAIQLARNISLNDISARLSTGPFYPDVWPGEHYRLLAAICQTLKPQLVIEVGTGQGLSALAMKKYLPPDAKIITFDVIPWQNYAGSIFQEDDFADERLQQIIADLSKREEFEKHKKLLQSANFLFLDASKDGFFERKFLQNLEMLSLSEPALIALDDIRVWNMLKIWREITRPKLDLTSFGHWSGTGLVEWTPKSYLNAEDAENIEL